MYRQQPPSIFTPPQTLRKRQHGYSTEGMPTNVGFSTQTSPRRQGWNQTLDLSVCQPANPFSNRFAILATPPEPTPLHNPTFPSFPVVPNLNRTRTRASRGTKEAKKRRDLRRNRRKLAAQMLDAQLAQTFNETLTRANIPPPPPARAAYLPAPPSPGQELPERLLGMGMRGSLPLTPPEMPMLEFEPFNIESIPHLLPANQAPEVHVIEPFEAELPVWCPPIRSLTMQDIWRECLPTFFDLSSLLEPQREGSAATGTRQCRELQLWKPPIVMGRKQSRFFPTTPKSATAPRDHVFGEPRVKVKLPPTRTKLHSTDTGLKRSLSTLNALTIPQPDHQIHLAHAKPNRKRPFQTREDHSTGPELQVHSYYQEKEVINSPTTVASPDEGILDEATAANLWRILRSNSPPGRGISGNPVSDASDEYIASHISYLPDPYEPEYDNLLYPWSAGYDPRDTSPQELDSREIPYVHANSLTGYSNETESTLIGQEYDDRPSLGHFDEGGDDLPIVQRHDPELQDSGIGLPGLQDDLIGFNEMLVDHDILASAANTPLPLTPPRTPVLTVRVEDPAHVLPIACIAQETEDTDDGTEREDEETDAQFQSEQALFQRSGSPTTSGFLTVQSDRASSCESLIDVEEFLKLGHARDCWCGACEGLENDSAVSLCLDAEEAGMSKMWPPLQQTAAASDVATTASEVEGDDGEEEEEWLVYSSGFPSPDSHASPVLAAARGGQLSVVGEQSLVEDLCLERRSSEWALEWE